MDSTSLILIGVVALVVMAIWGALKPRQPLPSTRRASLLTPGELRFSHVLLRAVPSGVVVCPKVRLMDVVGVPDDAWARYGARGSGMHVDFVLAEASTLAPLLAVELDDQSHQRPEAWDRDGFKNQALAAAGVPLLRVRAAARYGDLAGRIKTALC